MSLFTRLPSPTTVTDDASRKYLIELLRVLQANFEIYENVVNQLSNDNVVYVTQATDFPIEGNLVKTDPTKLYVICAMIDMGNVSIEVPSGGLNFAGLNSARELFGLYSTQNNHSMFVTPASGYAGNMLMENFTLYTTGTGSKIFNIDNQGNNGSFEFSNINFGGFGGIFCRSLGDITEYRQFFASGCGFYNIYDGFTMNETWSGLVLTDSNVLGSTAFTFFQEGTNLLFEGSCRSNVNFGATPGSINSSSVFMDFQESNFDTKGALALLNFRTSVDDALPNLDGSSSYVRYRDCSGVRNTYIGGQWSISSSAVTPLSGVAVSTPLKIAGTTSYNDLQWFTQTTDNSFVYDGDQEIEVVVNGNLSFSGTNNDVISLYIRQWDDSASSYIDLSETAGTTLNAAGRAEGVHFTGIGRINNGDRIELWVENETASRNVTALENGYVHLAERAS